MKKRVGFLVKLSKDFGEDGFELIEQKFVEADKLNGLKDISNNLLLLIEIFGNRFNISDDISILGKSELNVHYFDNEKEDLLYYRYPAIDIQVLSKKQNAKELNTYKVSADKVYCVHLGANAEESLFIDVDNNMFDRILNFEI